MMLSWHEQQWVRMSRAMLRIRPPTRRGFGRGKAWQRRTQSHTRSLKEALSVFGLPTDHSEAQPGALAASWALPMMTKQPSSHGCPSALTQCGNAFVGGDDDGQPSPHRFPRDEVCEEKDATDGRQALSTNDNGARNQNESDWTHRHEKRDRIMNALKKQYLFRIAVQTSGSEPPQGPRPDDRAISKRSWERSVAAWRRQLRAMATADEADEQQSPVLPSVHVDH